MNSRRGLRIASCMAPNADAMCRGIARYLQSCLGVPVELVDNASWRERERQLDNGDIDLCWICGVPYVEKMDAGQGIGLCVAPVMRGARYGNLPVYFSDVVVHAESRHMTFADLRGEAWAFNEPRSHSGYNVVRYYLATLGLTLDYFSSAVEAGAHQAALRMIVSGQVAGAAIDSTVLEAETRRDPALRLALRSVHTLGPSPAPPWVFSGAVSSLMRQTITESLAQMHRTPAGAAVLSSWGIAELRGVDDRAYDPIRRMMAMADAELLR